MNKQVSRAVAALVITACASAVLVGAIYLWYAEDNYYPSVVPLVQKKGLHITSPKPGEVIASPLKITGYADGDSWVPFEAQLGTVGLFDESGNSLAFGYLLAPGWLDNPGEPQNFELTLEFIAPLTENGTLVFANDNPSGLPEHERTLRLPIKFAPASLEETVVNVYFNSNQGADELACNQVLAVERKITKTPGIARATLEELLKGPTEEEAGAGFFTSINPGVVIQRLVIEQGAAKVDFNAKLDEGVGGSCRVAAIWAQIARTLLQFPTITSVTISIDGRSEDILQP